MSSGFYADSDSKRLGRCRRPAVVAHGHRTEKPLTGNLVIGTEETAEVEGEMEVVALYYRRALVLNITYAPVPFATGTPMTQKIDLRVGSHRGALWMSQAISNAIMTTPDIYAYENIQG